MARNVVVSNGAVAAAEPVGSAEQNPESQGHR
jgi:hypothetical protein